MKPTRPWDLLASWVTKMDKILATQTFNPANGDIFGKCRDPGHCMYKPTCIRRYEVNTCCCLPHRSDLYENAVIRVISSSFVSGSNYSTI